MKSAMIACVLLLAAAPAYAQSKLQVAQRCVAASEAGDSDLVQELSEEIFSWGTVYSPNLEAAGAACLSAATGEPWSYVSSEKMFMSDAEFAEMQEERRLEQRQILLSSIASRLLRDSQEAYAARNQSLVIESTGKACASLYEQDGDAALLNPVCDRHFRRHGHPELEGYLDFAVTFSDGFAEDLSDADRELLGDLERDELEAFCEKEGAGCVAATILTEGMAE